MQKPLLRVKNLNVVLDGEEIIKDLSFDVKKGDTLTILGPNGAGKTVLLKTILGFIPFKGEISWSDYPKIGYLPQGLTHQALKDIPISVKEFFELKRRKKEEIFQHLKMVGIEKRVEAFSRKRMGDLSSGQFQRVLVAWTLISKPDFLMFDEPTTAIDIGGEETIHKLLYRFWQKEKLTALMVTHDLNIVYKYSANVLCLTTKKISYRCPSAVLTPQVLKQTYGSEVRFYKHKH